MRGLVGTLVVALCVFLIPSPLAAQEFGGRIGDGPTCDGRSVVQCFNGVKWAGIGPPRGGPFIWAPGITRTYAFGPPASNGQWLLGLYAPPYFCVARLLPLVVCPGIIMTMLGSSGGTLDTQMRTDGL